MALPALLAVDDDAESLAAIERELRERYSRHYQVHCLSSPTDVRPLLEELAAADVDVALVLAAQWLPEMTGVQVLDSVRSLHAHARRALLIDWGEWGMKPTALALFDGIAHNQVDSHLLRPLASPDELFHQSISTMLLDWAEAHRAAPYTVHVIGESWSGRAYELRETLQHCAIPHHFCLADSDEGRALIDAAGARSDAGLPLMVFPNGHVLENPSNTELALAAGAPVDPESEQFDLIVVGAGPAGLSAAVYGASEGLSTLVVDRGGIGGQATSSSLIRNYLGFPSGVSGRQLARSAYDQAWVFGAQFVFMQSSTDLRREGDDLVITLSEGPRVRARAVLLSMGVSYRRLGVPALEDLVGAGVFYGGTNSEAPALEGRDVFVAGGANSAGQAALHLSQYAKRVTIAVRGPSLRVGMSEYLVSQIEATGNIEVRTGTQVVDGGGEGRLEHLTLRDIESETDATVDADALFVLIGAQPHTDWLPTEVERDRQGFILTGANVSAEAWPLARQPLDLETSMPGVFAGGDIRHGSVKRVASAVGEGSIAIQLVHQLLAANTAPGIQV